MEYCLDFTWPVKDLTRLRGHIVHLSPAERSWVFKGLQKFSNYSCWLRAYNNFGNGNWSEELVISTNEDGMLIWM